MKQALPKLDHGDSLTIYAISISPEWEHWHPTDCPAPIREWLDKNCPDVTVQAVSGWDGVASLDIYGMQIIDNGAFPEPMFRLGFSEQQAAQFDEWWSNPSNPGAETEENFWFLIVNRDHQYQPFVLQENDLFDLEIPPWQPPLEDQNIDAR
jgi:hypothetical protein